MYNSNMDILNFLINQIKSKKKNDLLACKILQKVTKIVVRKLKNQRLSMVAQLIIFKEIISKFLVYQIYSRMMFLKIKLQRYLTNTTSKLLISDIDACHRLNIKNVSPKRVMVSSLIEHLFKEFQKSKRMKLIWKILDFRLVWIKAQMLKKENNVVCVD